MGIRHGRSNAVWRIALIVSAIILAVLRPDAVAGPPAPPTGARADNQFALDLYAQVCRGPGNLILSPLSISSALAMAHAGAAGQTAQEISAVLHIPPDSGDAAAAYADLVGSLQSPTSAKVQVSVANAMWGEERVRFKKPFLDLLEHRYGATAASLGFARDPEGARRRINGWVADHTSGHIKELLGPGTIDHETLLVLTNAVYFKGAWAQRFEESKTRDGAFAAADGSKANVAMMQQTARFGYARGYDYAVLELPYEGQSLAMDVFLPDLRDGLPALEGRLTTEGLERDLNALRVQKVVAEIPRFTMTWGRELNTDLAALGLRLAFNPSADFSSMSDVDAHISKVAHQALLEVDEQGTKAAAATSVIIARSAELPPPVFRADHPFLFLIRDVKRGTILFMGRLVQPSG